MLRDEINAQQLLEWQAFYILEPFGEDWMQTAFICASVESSMGGAKFNPEKFLPVKPPERVPTAEEMWLRFTPAVPKP